MLLLLVLSEELFIHFQIFIIDFLFLIIFIAFIIVLIILQHLLLLLVLELFHKLMFKIIFIVIYHHIVMISIVWMDLLIIKIMIEILAPFICWIASYLSLLLRTWRSFLTRRFPLLMLLLSSSTIINELSFIIFSFDIIFHLIDKLLRMVLVIFIIMMEHLLRLILFLRRSSTNGLVSFTHVLSACIRIHNIRRSNTASFLNNYRELMNQLQKIYAMFRVTIYYFFTLNMS